MAQEVKTKEQPSIEAKPAAEDLSLAINQMMERKPDEHVKCVRIFGDSYRCNWWVQEKSHHWLSFCTGVIRKSRFLRVTQTAGKLHIEEMSERP